jgi:hypothetical protein
MPGCAGNKHPVTAGSCKKIAYNSSVTVQTVKNVKSYRCFRMVAAIQCHPCSSTVF